MPQLSRAADSAVEALSTHLDATDGHLEEAIRDLLVDLMHLADEKHMSFPAIMDEAGEIFAEESGLDFNLPVAA